MSRFESFSRGRQCPICDSHDGRCRETPDRLILCMNLLDAIDAPGYKHVGLSRDGTWGLWIPHHDQATEADRERWQQERARRQQELAQAEAQRRQEALPKQERHTLHLQLLAQLRLHPDDRKDLLQRGLSEQEIEQNGYRSVRQWQRIFTPLPSTLPGVQLDGRSLNVPEAGYLCPVRNEQGLIVGMQVRSRHPGDNGRKYYWLSSRTKKRPGGATPHLKESGELPLAVFAPDAEMQPSSQVALVEGTGAKPHLTSQRLGCVTIGAAGGNWVTGSTQFKHLLQHFTPSTVVLYPDAGAVANRPVMQQYRRTMLLLREWGYPLQVAWWGQLTKAHDDIDELPRSHYDQIKLIAFSEFEAIAEAELKRLHKLTDDRLQHRIVPATAPRLRIVEPDADEYAAVVAQQEAEERLSQARYRLELLEEIYALQGISFDPAVLDSNKRYPASGFGEVDLTGTDIPGIDINQLQSEQSRSTPRKGSRRKAKDIPLYERSIAELEAIRAVLREEVKRQRYQAETDRLQVPLNRLDHPPTIAAQGLYIPSGLLKLPERPGIIVVDGTMGVGKTSTALKELVEEHRSKHPDAQILLFTPRNMLGLQTGHILKLPHHTTVEGYLKKNQALTMCFESIWRIHPDEILPFTILFADEVSQSLKQMLEGNTTRQYQALILKRMREIFNIVIGKGGWIVLSEDGITNCELEFIKDCFTDPASVEVVEHLHFTKANHTPRHYRLLNSADAAWDEAIARLKLGQNLMLACDTKEKLKRFERELQKHKIDGCWFIYSESADQPWAKRFADDPQAWIEEYRPRLIAYSPTLNSGVSIVDKHGWFDAMAFCLTYLEPREAKQLPDRLRTNVERFGYVKTAVASAHDDDQYSASRPEAIRKTLLQMQRKTEKVIDFEAYVQAHPDEFKDAEGNPLNVLEAMAKLQEQADDTKTDFGFFLKHYSRYKARETYNKKRLREGLIAIWQAQGHFVTIAELDDSKEAREERQELRAQRQQIKEQLYREEAQAWATAEVSLLSVEDAYTILDDPTSSNEERIRARKRLLQEKLPGCLLLDDAEFLYSMVIVDRGSALRRAELLWLMQHPEAAIRLDQWAYASFYKRAVRRDECLILTQLPERAVQAKLLHECPYLQAFANGAIEVWDNDTEAAQQLHQWAVLRAKDFWRFLRLNIKSSHKSSVTVNKLLRKLGFTVEQRGWKGRSGGEFGRRQYAIQVQPIAAYREQVLSALSKRFIQQCKDRLVELPDAVLKALQDCAERNAGLVLPDHLPTEEAADIQAMWACAETEEARSAVIHILQTVAQRHCG